MKLPLIGLQTNPSGTASSPASRPPPLGHGPVLPAGASSVDNLVCKGLLAAGCKASKATAMGAQALLPHRSPLLSHPKPSGPGPRMDGVFSHSHGTLWGPDWAPSAPSLPCMGVDQHCRARSSALGGFPQGIL